MLTQVLTSAASSGLCRDFLFSSANDLTSWSPVGVRLPHRRQALLLTDVIVTITKLHPCRGHPLPEAPPCVASLNRPQAALGTVQYLQTSAPSSRFSRRVVGSDLPHVEAPTMWMLHRMLCRNCILAIVREPKRVTPDRLYDMNTSLLRGTH
ncbi:uncharacterized protein [Aegilops tauschii subsp. strangulata]|uniref:uncharacterized protein n=1 Tax=Aegilops tauschii subsp. strangulata TaxID=200361 RepID=UPI001ABCEF6D|nr:uncharacterized protein LOC109780360 isoform X2 [Aegilops tauschii subsp. strangulata]